MHCAMNATVQLIGAHAELTGEVLDTRENILLSCCAMNVVHIVSHCLRAIFGTTDIGFAKYLPVGICQVHFPDVTAYTEF